MSNYNHCTFLGRLTRSPEVRTSKSDMQIASASLAVNRKRAGEDEPMFLDVVAFGKTAEIMAQYVGKGELVLLDGELVLNRWEDKQGNKRQKHELLVNRLTLMPKAETRSAGPKSATMPQDEYTDIPF